MSNISVFGVGKLGLCFSLNLERAGHSVLGVDRDQKYIDTLNNKTFSSSEDQVDELLRNSINFEATVDVDKGLEHSDTIFVLVATPSLADGRYDHSQIDGLVDQLVQRGRQESPKDLIIGCTTMPGYCDELQERVKPYNYRVLYNPEFIAQGTVIKDQLHPDMVLIGSSDQESSDKLVSIYESLVKNEPKYCVMSRISAEICKISLNCFITTKIAFTNMIGDLADKVGGDSQEILTAIGSDSRVGLKCMRYGFGYGGPCFPRDNRALGVYAKEKGCSIHISDATDKCNSDHLQYMVNCFKEDEVTFSSVSYKPESTILEESQQLAFAVALARKGVRVTISERQEVVDQLRSVYGDLFNYA